MYDLDEMQAQVDTLHQKSAVERMVWIKDFVRSAQREREEACRLLGRAFEVAFGFAPDQAWEGAHRQFVREISPPPHFPKHRKEGAAR